MVRIMLTVSPEMNNWIKASGGDEEGDRQRFILTTLKMWKNGFIVKGTGVSQIKSSDLKENIDILRAKAEADARNRSDDEFKSGKNAIFFTPVDILEEIKSLPRFKSISHESKDTIRIMQEEKEKVSSVVSKSITPPVYPTPPPPPPPIKKDDKNDR